MQLDKSTLLEKDKNPRLGSFSNLGESKQKGLKQDIRTGAFNKANLRIIKTKIKG